MAVRGGGGRGRSQSWGHSDKHGWLWKRGGDSRIWLRKWCQLKGATLLVFNDDSKDAEPTETLRLDKSQLSEVTFQDGFRGGKRYSRGFLLRVTDPHADNDISKYETESLLHSRLDYEMAVTKIEYLLAAEDSLEHNAWLKKLTKVSANGVSQRNGEEVYESRNSGKSFASAFLGPSPMVVSKLCSTGREKGKELLNFVRKTRRAFEQSLQNLGNVRDEAKAVQQHVVEVHAFLLELDAAISAHSSSGDQSADEIKAMKQCRDWLNSAQAFIMEVDHHIDIMIHKDGTPFLAGEWASCAQNTVLQLRDIEEALVVAQIQELEDFAATAPPNGTLSRSRCRVTIKAQLPYNTYWARKIAL